MKILVTGASKGIGKAIAELLIEDGHNVYGTARTENLIKDYEKYCVCDLATHAGIEKIIEFIKENEIDVLINNAGEYIYSPIQDITYEKLEHITKLNLETPLCLISAVVPNMKKKIFGRIINIGSISGVMGEANASLYSATKAGLIGATKALALELAEYNITVNTINPGWVDTELGNSSIEDSDFTKDEIIDCIPQKRFVAPKEIAGMVRYLISEDAKGVTGQSINLCAGLSVGY
ncbi:MAG: SDR family oxidoreductase [bacterium]|nr:SDR family oxidoreductase [bacterium]